MVTLDTVVFFKGNNKYVFLEAYKNRDDCKVS